MSIFRVANQFRAFARDYRRDEVLTDADLECWQPDEQRAIEVAKLIRRGDLDPVGGDGPAGGYPATGGAPEAAPATDVLGEQSRTDEPAGE